MNLKETPADVITVDDEDGTGASKGGKKRKSENIGQIESFVERKSG